MKRMIPVPIHLKPNGDCGGEACRFYDEYDGPICGIGVWLADESIDVGRGTIIHDEKTGVWRHPKCLALAPPEGVRCKGPATKEEAMSYVYNLAMSTAENIKKSANIIRLQVGDIRADLLSGGGPKGIGTETERAAAAAALEDAADELSALQAEIEATY